MKKYIGLFNLFLFHQLLSCANDNITGVVFQLADRSSVNKITPAIFDLAVRNGLKKKPSDTIGSAGLMIFGPINNSQRSISGLSIVVNMTSNQVIIRRDHSPENDPLVFEIEKNITMVMCTKIGSNKWSKAKKKGSLTFDFG